jgi:hypothetical protein
MFFEDLTMTGQLKIVLNDEVVQETNNLVVTAGKEWVADRMKGSNSAMSHMAIGTGSTAAAAGNTALGNELDRNSLSTAGGTVSGATITFECTWAAGDGTGAITEAGIFDASSGGDMLARTVFAVVNKGSSDVMTISWVVTVS